MKKDRVRLILWIIIITGSIARMIKFGDTAAGTDVAAFSRLGWNFIESGRYAFGENYNMGVFFPPGYPLFIGIINLFAHDLFFSAKLVSFISSVLTIPLFYLLGRELYNEESGLFAAFAYAFYPLSIILGVYGNSDALFFCFFFLAIYLFLLTLKRDSLILSLLFAVSTGLATITRPEGMFLFILPFLHFIGLFVNKPSSPVKYMGRVIIMLSVFVMIITPYILFVKNYTGKFAMSGKNNIAVLLAEMSYDTDYHEMVNAPKNLYDKAAFTLTSDKTQLSGWNRYVQRSLLRDYILKDPVKFLIGFQKKIFIQIKTLVKLFLPVMIPLLFLFLDKNWFSRRTVLIFILFPVIYFLMYPIFVIIERQTYFIVLFPMILSSIGFASSKSALNKMFSSSETEKNRVFIFMQKNVKNIIIIVLIMSSLIYLKYSSFDKVPIPVEHARAGYFIKNKVTSEYEKINVMSAKPIVSFYSGARFTMLPYANSRDVLEFAKLYQVDFIAIDERLMSEWDFYDELLQMDRRFADVELAYEDAYDKKIKLFKIKK